MKNRLGNVLVLLIIVFFLLVDMCFLLPIGELLPREGFEFLLRFVGFMKLNVIVILEYIIVPYLLYYKKYKSMWIFLMSISFLYFIRNLPACEPEFSVLVPFVYAIPVFVIFYVFKACRGKEERLTWRDYVTLLVLCLMLALFLLLKDSGCESMGAKASEVAEDTFTPAHIEQQNRAAAQNNASE